MNTCLNCCCNSCIDKYICNIVSLDKVGINRCEYCLNHTANKDAYIEDCKYYEKDTDNTLD